MYGRIYILKEKNINISSSKDNLKDLRHSFRADTNRNTVQQKKKAFVSYKVKVEFQTGTLI